MKKSIAIALVFSIIMALCACTASDTPSKTIPTGIESNNTVPTETTAPTQPPLTITERLLIYWEIWSGLKRYEQEGYDNFMLVGQHTTGVPNGNEGLKYCYEYLLTMEDLKPYLTKEGWKSQVQSYECPDQTPDELLSRFTVLEDVLLGLKYTENPSSLSEVQYDEHVIWRYNTKGQLVHLNQQCWSPAGIFRLPENRFYTRICSLELYYEYDENGDLLYQWFGDNQTGTSPIVPTYDDTGRLIQEQCGQNFLLYSYNDHGHWSAVEHRRYGSFDEHGDPIYYSTRWEFSYTYDNHGNVTQCIEKEYSPEDLMFTRTEDYIYDENGQVCTVSSSVDIWEWYVSEPFISRTDRCTIRYTYDEQGRILTKSVCQGGEPDANGTPTHERILSTETYLYGDHYIFDEYEVDFVEKTR